MIRPTGIVAFALIFCIGPCLGIQAQVPSPIKNEASLTILFLSDFDPIESEAYMIAEGIRKVVEDSGRHAEIFIEHQDLLRLLPMSANMESFRRHLLDRYENVRFDIIVAQSSTSLRVAFDFREAHAPGIPIYCFDMQDPAIVDRFSKAGEVYGRPVGDAMVPTIRLAHRLLPKASKAYLFATFPDLAYVPDFNELIDSAREEMPGLEFDIRINPDFAEVESALSSAGPESFALLLPGIFRLSSGDYITGRSAVDSLSATNLPLFGFFPFLFGTGLVGGCLFDREYMGREAGAMILSILYGKEKPDPWAYSNAFASQLDYRALRRFSVPQRLVPADAAIKFAPPTFWVAYKAPIQAFGAVLIVALVGLVLYSLYRRKERELLVEGNARLERNVALRTEELRTANVELEAMNENLRLSLRKIEGMQERLVSETRDTVLGRIALGLAHDINNPLAAIRASLGSIGDLVGAGKDDLLSTVSGMGPEESALLFRLHEEARKRPIALEENGGSKRRVLEARLKDLEAFPDGRIADIADLLVDAGLDALDDGDLRLIGRNENRGVLEALYRVRLIESVVAVSSQAADRISRTVEAVRSYARDSQGGAEGGRASVKESIERALSLFDERIKAGVELRLALDESLPPVCASDTGLVRLWANLIQNALQAMKGSGKLDIRSRAEDGFAIVEILDSGPGVPPGIRDKLFTPFAATAGIERGMGLGLSICKRIAEGCGGTISHGEKEGRTMFTARIPLADG